MINKRKRLTSRVILFSLILAYSIMPIISRVISDYLTTYFYLLIVLFTFFTILFCKGKFSFNKYSQILLPFILFQALTLITNTGSIAMWVYQVLLFLLPIVLAYYLLYENPQYIPLLCNVMFIIFIVTIITTISGLTIYPSASRILASTDSSQDVAAVIFNWKNIGGYDFVYTLVLLYPLVILAFKQKKLPVVLTAIIVAAIFTVILMAQYTTALLLFIVSSFLFLFKRELTVKNTVIFSICGILCVLIFNSVFSDLLIWLADQLNSFTFKERLISLAGGTEGLESSEGGRIYLWRNSLNTFLSSPIFGIVFKKEYRIGGHYDWHDFTLLNCFNKKFIKR